MYHRLQEFASVKGVALFGSEFALVDVLRFEDVGRVEVRHGCVEGWGVVGGGWSWDLVRPLCFWVVGGFEGGRDLVVEEFEGFTGSGPSIGIACERPCEECIDGVG
mmetsp:Transcript_10437/g.12260  ORF Transcript_10437/g.12260 Transcript_10437/m.12260 type:complete len:106 (+) Transcript_10437:459-776(+)